MENTTDYLKPYLLLICRKKQKIGTGKVRDNRIVLQYGPCSGVVYYVVNSSEPASNKGKQ